MVLVIHKFVLQCNNILILLIENHITIDAIHRDRQQG